MSSALHDVLDHLGQPQVHAVVRVIDAFDAIVFQSGNFLQGNRAAAAAEHLDMVGAALTQLIDHVAKIFHVTTLVTGDGNGVGVFLDGRANDIQYAAVVAQVDDLAALRLDQPPHDIDGRVVTIEQAGGCNETQRQVSVFRLGRREFGHGAHGHLPVVNAGSSSLRMVIFKFSCSCATPSVSPGCCSQ